MACNHQGGALRQGNTYTTAEGKQFSARVQASPNLLTGTQWPDLLNKTYDDRRPLLHNIPNGAGPGTLVLQSFGACADWTILAVRDKVSVTQRAYTGYASWEQVYLEDGGNVHARVQGQLGNITVNADGILNSTVGPSTQAGAPWIASTWYPSGASIPTFDRLSLMTGPTAPQLPNGFPLRSLPSQNVYSFVPPGNCRFFTYDGVTGVTIEIRYESAIPAVSYPINTTQVAPGNHFAYSCPAWGIVDVRNTTQGTIDFAICWNRYPLIGAP